MINGLVTLFEFNLMTHVFESYLPMSLLEFSFSFIVMFFIYCLLAAIILMQACFYGQAPYVTKIITLWVSRCKISGIPQELIQKLTGKNFEVFLAGALENEKIRKEYEAANKE